MLHYILANFDKIMHGAPPLLLFRTVARNPRVLQGMMAGGLLDRGRISLRSRELMTLRTCVRRGAEYEWDVRVAIFGAKAQGTPARRGSRMSPNPSFERIRPDRQPPRSTDVKQAADRRSPLNAAQKVISC